MKNICLYFQVHQPFRLRTYRFFDIGNHNNYFDHEKNAAVMRKVAEKCYLPANAILLELINKFGKRFKVGFSISGMALEQFEKYTPEVLESFQKLAATGCVEFLAETYSHSLAVLKSEKEFIKQVQEHSHKIKKHFGQQPQVFRNTELIYSNSIGKIVSEMGFKAMLAEGADHILQWRSPNFLYYNSAEPKLKLLLKNYRLSDDIAFRFSQESWNGFPLTAHKYVHWLNAIPSNEEIVNLFMDYETFGEHQWEETGIFEFLKAFPAQIFSSSNFRFVTPSEAVERLHPVALLHVPHPVSWADMERDLSAWLGNDLQHDAFDTLYQLEKKISFCDDEQILRDWKYLQTSDHFYYMCTKYFSDGDVHKYFNHYNSPYDAFINYMNVLSDFEDRVNKYFEERIIANQRMKVKAKIQIKPLKIKHEEVFHLN
ncbi:MAG TPA: glycoside hydrolase family 57 protein [Bacteroidia bacterium]|nr:glycoside hydrolase family 57 protein [Bacteroidia bacterium]